ncbi:MAG: polysaccharide biosynthesis protein [Chitinophagaceae bacterium]|jgi:FlaA1/EpsC-like NDP-sugar epimerase
MDFLSYPIVMLMLNYNKVASRWLIFAIEQVLAACAFLCAFLIAGEFYPVVMDRYDYVYLGTLNAFVTGVCMLILKTHVGIIRLSSIRDVQTILTFGLMQYGFWLMIIFLFPELLPTFGKSKMIMLMNALLASLLMITFRLLVKEVFSLGGRMRGNRFHVMIYGANNPALSAFRAIELERGSNRYVVAFVDHGRDRIGKSLNGKTVISGDLASLRKFIRDHSIKEFILAEDNLDPVRKSELLALCGEFGIRPTVVPPFTEWINGKFRSNQIKSLTIESILNRETIILTHQKAQEDMSGAIVLVTGAAGSIGSEICRQLCRYKIHKLILLDQSETGLHDILNELDNSTGHAIDLSIELATIRDRDGIDRILDRHRPHFVYHAAAYKHVPILEQFPAQVVLTNVMGTKILADAAHRYGVRKFVMISTDKAVNPTNLMGASKRIAELYVNSLEGGEGTQFITTRFGNVLGSNGSVVPLFRQQIEKGGPVTVTHPEISRFFMTIPEASSLVIEASIMGTGGEIFVFDMGKPEKILDMARKMIQLAGFRPDIDIRIEFTGLRKGEKLHEELFKAEESPLPTHHPKIMIAQHRKPDHTFHDDLLELIHHARKFDGNDQEIRVLVQRMIPEFSQLNQDVPDEQLVNAAS